MSMLPWLAITTLSLTSKPAILLSTYLLVATSLAELGSAIPDNITFVSEALPSNVNLLASAVNLTRVVSVLPSV